MGIKHLWTILGPFCDRKPLFELQGKTVAVDLSGWICEAQNITEYQVQPKMYLRLEELLFCNKYENYKAILETSTSVHVIYC